MKEIKLSGKNMIIYENILNILRESPKGKSTPHYVNRFNSIISKRRNIPKLLNVDLRSETDHYKRHLLIAWINNNSYANTYRKSRYYKAS